jgi:hypothetical protein
MDRRSPEIGSVSDARSHKQRLDKGIGVKRLEIVQRFADTDELDG